MRTTGHVVGNGSRRRGQGDAQVPSACSRLRSSLPLPRCRSGFGGSSHRDASGMIAGNARELIGLLKAYNPGVSMRGLFASTLAAHRPRPAAAWPRSRPGVRLVPHRAVYDLTLARSVRLARSRQRQGPHRLRLRRRRLRRATALNYRQVTGRFERVPDRRLSTCAAQRSIRRRQDDSVQDRTP